MRLYMHPVSNPSRALLFYIADNDLPVEEVVVDLADGAQHREPYSLLNPSHQVPTLVDGDFILSESSAILKYLAETFEQPTYPKELRKRARVNELMDWLNTSLYRDYGCGFVLPQVYPQDRQDELRPATIARHRALARKWLGILNDHWLFGRGDYLVADELTIADYFGAALVTCGELIRADLSAWPNVEHWLDGMKRQPGWDKANEGFLAFRDSLKDRTFEAL